MTWLAIRILLGGWLKRAGGALTAAFRWLTSSVDHLMIAALALTIVIAVCEYQTIGKKTATIARLTAQIGQFRDAQAKAKALAQEALHHQEAVYQAKAQEADHAYQTQLADARSAADRYIAAHRLRADGSGSTGGTAASAQGGDSGIPASVPADAVVVSAGDVQACTDAVTYGQKAHDWALGLGQSSSDP